MKSFLLRLSAFALLMIGVLYLLTAFTDSRLRSRNKGRMRVWHEVERGAINADVLILGSSHAHVQVNPRLLATAFPGKRIYNLGLEGYTFDMQSALYHFYRRHNKAPETILVCADYMEFGRSRWEVDRTQFLPYLYDSAILAGLREIGFSKSKALFPFLKYGGEANAVIAAINGKSPLPDDKSERRSWDGFEPVNLRWDEKAFISDTLHAHFTPNVDSNTWHLFQGFILECTRENIHLYVAFTPHYERFTRRVVNAIGYRQWLRKTLQQQTAFIDFSEAYFCGDTTLFYNGTHLNARGANVFTTAIADSLRRYLNP